MPSSMIFVGLVVIWLLILVPAVARHRQEVARPSVAALSGRVLERPRRRQNLEVDLMDDVQQSRPVATRTDRDDEHLRVPAARVGGEAYSDDTDAGESADDLDDSRWERPPPRYRPGRGGYDPESAALAARSRYAFRQRVVLAMLVAALVTGVLAAVAVPTLWWPHAAVDVLLVGYLAYLRRQVRMEESIRDRRAARMAGTRRSPAAEDPELDEWARRGRDEVQPDAGAVDDSSERPAEQEADDGGTGEPGTAESNDAGDLDREEPERVAGAGEPLRETETGAALPRLLPAPPPPLPPGTILVEVDDQDPDLHELDGPVRPDYRRAAGQ